MLQSNEKSSEIPNPDPEFLLRRPSHPHPEKEPEQPAARLRDTQKYHRKFES